MYRLSFSRLMFMIKHALRTFMFFMYSIFGIKSGLYDYIAPTPEIKSTQNFEKLVICEIRSVQNINNLLSVK